MMWLGYGIKLELGQAHSQFSCATLTTRSPSMPVSDQATPAIALPVHHVKRTHLNKEKQNPQERLLAACMHYGESCLHAAGTIVNVWPVVHTDTSSGLISTAPHLLSQTL